MKKLFGAVLKSSLKFISKLLFNVKLVNFDKINFQPNSKNIFVCNHPSFLDGIMIGLFLPCKPVFLVHTTIFKRPLFRFLLQFVDTLSIEPSSPMALKTLANAVNAGRPVVIFPEGRITITGSLMKIYEGSAFVAAKTNANVIPLTLQGLLKSKVSRMSNLYPKTWFPNITITAHDSFKIEVDQTLSAKLRRNQAGEKLKSILQLTGFKSIDTDKSIYQSFVDSMNYFGKNHIVIEDLDRAEISYSKLNLMSQGVGFLISKYTEKNEFVGLLLPNTPICAATFLGLNAYGRVPSMLNYTMSGEAFLSCLKSSVIKQIITSKVFIDKGKLNHLIDIADNNNINVLYLEDLKSTTSFFDKLTIKYRSLFNWNEISNPNEPAVVLFTSGSEGTPKGVVLSNKAILSNIAQIKSIIDIMFEDKVCNVLPMFHSFGLTAGTLLPLLSGTKLLLYVSPLHYKVVPELIYDRNCTIMFGTNTFLFNYAKHANNYDFFKLRYVIAGAEKVSDITRNTWFEKFGIRILEGYGATECAPVIAVNTPMGNKFGTVGKFLPDIQYKLEEISGVEGGKLLIKGPNLMLGYLKDTNPGVIEKAQEWYDTGDIISVSNDGFVSIKGRVKRFVKIAGEMVSLEAVDKVISLCSDKLCATTSRPDINKGEQIILFTLDESLTKDKIRKVIIENNYSNLMIPSEIKYVNSIPLLGSGKIDYQELKKLV